MSLSSHEWPRGRRERKAQRERDAELDKLTVRARLAAVTARELTVATLTEVYRHLIDRAVHRSGHVANGAAKLVLSWPAPSMRTRLRRWRA
jgi:hypothetical protein